MSEYRLIEVERARANEQFDERIKELRKTCKHEISSEWLEGANLKDVRICLNCHAITASRYSQFCYA